MTPERRRNLERLLRPRHIALVGGRDAEVAAGECARIGFDGPVWPVNPKRQSIGGHPCFARVEDLPEPPDAVFLAVPRETAVDTLAKLNRLGAGGVVCYTAGFAETGAEGAALEAALVEATGKLALVGPNCYGLINYIDGAALWPFAHGGACPGYGAAIITQSGMLSSDLTMAQRSLPLTHMVSLGNQAVLELADFVELLSGQEGVRAIGLHIEGLKDVPRFTEAALKALDAHIPLVALKTGSSKIGAQLAASHTGSLSGEDDLYQALFDRLGIIRVSNPAQMLETLKFLCVAGVPEGIRIAGLTCSGGSAAMLADHAERIGLAFPRPSEDTATLLQCRLPRTATVSNPLDYTTPIWGDPDRVHPVFDALFRDPYDAALMVQDYPLTGLDESKTSYLADAESFIAATRAAVVPAAICSTLPESLDEATRTFLISQDIAPMQGIHETLDAIAGAAWYGARRPQILAARPNASYLDHALGETLQLDEWQGKAHLKAAGLKIPEGRLVAGDEAPHAAAELGFPVALKMASEGLTHKTEAAAVRLGLESAAAVEAAVAAMRRDVAATLPDAFSDNFLVERMIAPPLAELLASVRVDPQFGPAMTIASGGILAELVGDAVTLLLPANTEEIVAALDRLKVSRLLNGFRGGPQADRAAVVGALTALADYTQSNSDSISEIEINPLFILPDEVYAVDVLMRVRRAEPAAAVSA